VLDQVSGQGTFDPDLLELSFGGAAASPDPSINTGRAVQKGKAALDPSSGTTFESCFPLLSAASHPAGKFTYTVASITATWTYPALNSGKVGTSLDVDDYSVKLVEPVAAFGAVCVVEQVRGQGTFDPGWIVLVMGGQATTRQPDVTTGRGSKVPGPIDAAVDRTFETCYSQPPGSDLSSAVFTMVGDRSSGRWTVG
jgi:hypothetical protein